MPEKFPSEIFHDKILGKVKKYHNYYLSTMIKNIKARKAHVGFME